jgi:hypothetical protein
MDILYQIIQTKYQYDSKEADKEQIGGGFMGKYKHQQIQEK